MLVKSPFVRVQVCGDGITLGLYLIRVPVLTTTCNLGAWISMARPRDASILS